MSKLTLEKFCEILNENFGEPHLVNGGVTAEIFVNDDGTKELSINIGRRDVQIDEQGFITGSGTFLGMSNDTLFLNEEDI